MIEIFNIIVQIFFSILIISFPINLFESNLKIRILSFDIIDKLLINLIIFVNFLLLVSFFNININYIFIFYIALMIIFYLLNIKVIKFDKLKFNYYFLFLLFFIFIISIDLAHELYFGWDASRNWYFKVLNFFQNKDIENLKNFYNVDYPHLGSFIWAFFWKIPFGSHEYYGRIFYVIIYVLSIFSIIKSLKVSTLEKLIFSILLILLTYNYKLFSGLQDVLIFSFILIGSRFIYILLDEKNDSINTYLIFIILGTVNILFWIKNEGVFYGLFLLFCLYFSYNFSNKHRWYLIISSLIIIIFRVGVFNYYHTELNNEYFQLAKILNFDFLNTLSNVKTVTFYLFVNLTRNLIYLLSLPILIYILIKYKIRNVTKFVSYFFILNFIFIYSAYLFKMEEVELLLKASMDRVLFQTSGIYILIIIVFINYYSEMFIKYKKK